MRQLVDRTDSCGIAARAALCVAAAGLALGAPACEKSSDRSEQREEPSAASSEQAEGGEKSSEAPDESGEGTPAASGWERVSEDELSDEETDQLERARAARKRLGSTLKKELKSAVSERSFSGAVEFCRDRAPEIAREVADDRDVNIGRTSHRLRNPDNHPPAWAKAAVERKEAQTYTYRGPDRQLGYLRPIKLKGLCVNCHGSRDQLAPDVPEMLDKHYPEDRATGFEVGDLRGWFWVEVPPGAS